MNRREFLARTARLVRKGMARLTGAPGLGLSLRENRLEKPSILMET